MAKRRRLSLETEPRADRPALETKAIFPGDLPAPALASGLAPGLAPGPRAPIAGVAGEAAAVAALGEMSRDLETARAEGRYLMRLPLDAVDESYLVRDRLVLDEAELAGLAESLARRGQQTAIEVADLGPDLESGATPRWGLISGWRRLTALRRLAEAGRGPGEVLAALRAPQDAAEAYQAMVEENEVRSGLSHYERARIVARAADRGAFAGDREALAALFAAATRPRRSKIGSFVRIVRALDGALRYPAALPERLGLALAKALETDPALAERIAARLTAVAPDSPEAEQRLLAAAIRAETAPAAPKPVPSAAPDIAYDAVQGRLTLSGAAVRSAGFRNALAAWLAARGWEG